MLKKNNLDKKFDVYKELKGFDIKINEFGEIKINLEVDCLN